MIWGSTKRAQMNNSAADEKRDPYPAVSRIAPQFESDISDEGKNEIAAVIDGLLEEQLIQRVSPPLDDEGDES